jgi:hypothetical protein
MEEPLRFSRRHPDEDAVPLDVARLRRIEQAKPSAVNEEDGLTERAAVDEREGVRATADLGVAVVAERVVTGRTEGRGARVPATPLGGGMSGDGDDSAAVAQVDLQRADATVGVKGDGAAAPLWCEPPQPLTTKAATAASTSARRS